MDKVSWLDTNTLAYSRMVRSAEGTFFDLYKLELNSKNSTRLTEGLRLRQATAHPDGCIWAFQDALSTS
ncbi:MAG: hypothetical protein R2865_09375 [Deinococcales bacterium]